jgi:hypothetical protein
MPDTPYIQAVRAMAVLGALLFAYLAVPPAALVGSTIDPACESCGSAAPVRVYLVITFAACSLALVGAAVSLLAFAARPSQRTERIVGLALRASAAAIALLLFSEFALAYPVPAIVTVGISAAAVWLITRGHRPTIGTQRPPR